MALFKRNKGTRYAPVKWKGLASARPVVDFENDRYTAKVAFVYTDEEGIDHPVDLELNMRDLHQLTINLYLICKRFNLPVDRPLAERARQFWGMSQ